MGRVTYKYGDTLPDYIGVLKHKGKPINLTDATVTCRLYKEPHGKNLAMIKDVTVYEDLEEENEDEQIKVKVEWDEGDLVTTYYVEFRVEYPSGKRLSVPNDAYDEIEVVGGPDDT